MKFEKKVRILSPPREMSSYAEVVATVPAPSYAEIVADAAKESPPPIPQGEVDALFEFAYAEKEKAAAEEANAAVVALKELGEQALKMTQASEYNLPSCKLSPTWCARRDFREHRAKLPEGLLSAEQNEQLEHLAEEIAAARLEERKKPKKPKHL